MVKISINARDILPEFESYVIDLENCLKSNPADWKRYLSNRTPFLIDLLGDFGRGDWTLEQITEAAENYGK